MKKAIAYAAAFALAFAQPYTAMCAELVSESQNTGTQSVFLAVDSEITVTNGKITIEYDGSLLSLEEIKFCGTLKNALIAVNNDVPGKIVIGFANKEPAVIADCLAELIFTGSTESGAACDGIKSMTVNELVTENEKGEDVILPAETVLLAGSKDDFTVSCSDSVSDTEGSLSTYLQFDHALPFTNGTFTISYDPSVLSFTGGETCGILKDSIYEINETEPGTIRFTFISETALNANGTAVKLDFTGLKKSETEITVSADELSWISADGTVINRSTVSEKSKIAVNIPERNAELTVSEGDKTNTAVIGISEESHATNGVFTVKYDPEMLKFDSGEICEGFSGIMADFNETEPGTVKAVFISDSEITAGGSFIKLNFIGLKTGKCEITAESDEMMQINASGTSNNITCTSGTGEINCEGAKTEKAEKSVIISFTEAEGVTDGSFTIDYDSSEYKFEGIESNNPESKTELKAVEEKPGSVKITFSSEEPVSADGTDFKVNFTEINENPAEIKLEVNDVTLMAGENKISNFKISFTEDEPGNDNYSYDVDGNGVVTAADLISLARIIAGTGSGSADINGDGKTDSADILLLIKMLSK